MIWIVAILVFLETLVAVDQYFEIEMANVLQVGFLGNCVNWSLNIAHKKGRQLVSTLLFDDLIH